MNTDLALDLTGFKTKTDFIDEQDDLIKRTKNEMALVEFRANSRGGESYSIPEKLMRGKGDTRARRDSYSAFLLANWAKKCYFDMINYKTAPKQKNTFTPMLI